MKNRFEISTEGMRELQSGREPWQLAKELISNAWDEKATICRVTLRALTTRTAYFSVYDNGQGFKDIADAWTLMKHTDKRLDPEVRGRFNIGEKEILSIAQAAKITTSGKTILFPKTGGRKIRTNTKPIDGTLVEVWLLWGSNQVKETIERLTRMLPPHGITYTINGNLVEYQNPYKVTEATLETVIQSSLNEPMTTSRRKSKVEIYPNLNEHKSILYEMGIPVQTIGCPYSVNVMQKIPLPPNRDTVKSSYLQDIYAIVLNATADEVKDAAANWTRMAIEDKEVTPKAVKTIIQKRYGDKVALWSSETKSNERAMLAGYEIVNPRTLSQKEREIFSSIGISHTSDIFPIGYKPMDSLTEEQLTDGMKTVRQYAKQLYRGLFHKELGVGFFNDFKIGEGADFSMGHINFNIGRLGKAWFDAIDERTTSLLLHEFAHTEGVGHEPSYYRSLEKLAGRAVHLALTNPEIFKVVNS
jgi:hypothetical protein